jgi:hypothetical protein
MMDNRGIVQLHMDLDATWYFAHTKSFSYVRDAEIFAVDPARTQDA